MTFKKKVFSIILLMISAVIGISIFQNCAPQSSSSVANVNANSNSAVSNAVKAIHWRYTSGSVSPDYQYSVEYDVDFQTKNFIVAVSKGPLSMISVSPANKYLNDSQISDIKNLFNQITYSNCSSGSQLVGGGLDLLNVYVSSLSSPDVSIYNNNCVGYSESNAKQALSNYKNLSDYLQSL